MLALVVVVVGLDAWRAAQHITRPARRYRDVVARPLHSEATISRPSGRVSVTVLIPARTVVIIPIARSQTTDLNGK